MQAQAKIRQWCKEEGRKLSWLALQVPITGGQLTRWLNGKTRPSTIYRNRLADITGIEDLRREEEWTTEGAMS